MTINNGALKLILALSDTHVERLAFESSNGPIKIDGGLFAFLKNNPDTRLLPKGPHGVCYIFKSVNTADLEYWNDGKLQPTAITHNGKRTLAFWALEAPVPADHPALIKLMDWLHMSKDETIPLPGQGGWKLHYVHLDRTYTPDQMVEVYLRENRRFAKGKLSRKGRF